MNNLPISNRYIINPGTIDRVAAFKEFVGAGQFESILQGIHTLDIPLEENRYEQLLRICLDEPYFKTAGTLDMHQLKNIPYNDAEEIISFFCTPFAGRFLKQMTYTLTGVSSFLQKLPPEVLQTLMQSGTFPKPKDITTDASSLQTETSSREKGSTEPQHQAGLPN